jgi:molecular chaperone GrpE
MRSGSSGHGAKGGRPVAGGQRSETDAPPPPGAPAGGEPGDAVGRGSEPALGSSAAAPGTAPPGAPAEPREEERELRDRLLRSLADFENYRKRSRREQADAVRRASEEILLEVLDVLDDFERGLDHASAENETEGLRHGMEITLRSFRELLARRGVREMDALGEVFDPHRHEAVMEESAEGVPSGSVARVVRKGYLHADRVLRPARVVVAR